MTRCKTMSKSWIQLLGSDRRSGQGNVDTNGSGGAHGMRSVANQEHASAGPLFAQGDVSFEEHKGLEVVESVGEIGKERVQATHAVCHHCNAGLTPVAPVARGEKQASLNMVRVLGV